MASAAATAVGRRAVKDGELAVRRLGPTASEGGLQLA